MKRLTTIMEAYKLSWEDVRMCTEEDKWNERISDSLCLDFSEYCAKEATRYQHPLLSWPTDTMQLMQPRIRQCLQFGGELALAALRIRAPHLRLLPSMRRNQPLLPDQRIDCRWCGRPRLEYGRHLIFCHALPSDLRKPREAVIKSISLESGQPVITRPDREAMESYIINFDWPNQREETLKALLILCRNLVNRYAVYVPQWEGKDLAAFPVRRVRPVHSYTSTMENVEPS